MPLEPTEDIEAPIRAILGELCCLPSSTMCSCDYGRVAREVFAYVRDIVLEEYRDMKAESEKPSPILALFAKRAKGKVHSP